MLLQGGACLLAALSAGAFAQAPPASGSAYPAKPVRLVAPYPAGGVNDIVARMLGSRMAAALGQQVAIDNRAGRGGVIGSELVARAPPDGYTLVPPARAGRYGPPALSAAAERADGR